MKNYLNIGILVSIAGLGILTDAVIAKEETLQVAIRENVQHLKIKGGTPENATQIEEAAKEAGAMKPSFNAKTGILSYEAEKLIKHQVLSKIQEKIPGVSRR